MEEFAADLYDVAARTGQRPLYEDPARFFGGELMRVLARYRHAQADVAFVFRPAGSRPAMFSPTAPTASPRSGQCGDDS